MKNDKNIRRNHLKRENLLSKMNSPSKTRRYERFIQERINFYYKQDFSLENEKDILKNILGFVRFDYDYHSKDFHEVEKR